MTVRNERVLLDGNTFTGCTFEDCSLVLTGEQDVVLNVNHIRRCQYLFEGPALRTLHFLHALYHNSGGGDRLVVEEIIEQIRTPRPA